MSALTRVWEFSTLQLMVACYNRFEYLAIFLNGITGHTGQCLGNTLLLIGNDQPIGRTFFQLRIRTRVQIVVVQTSLCINKS